MKICALGKPRCGTTSIAKALTILGYNTIHFCPLTTNDNSLGKFIETGELDPGLTTYDAIVSWRLTPYVKTLYKHFDIDKYILLDRKSNWEISCEQIGMSPIDITKTKNYFNVAASFLNRHKKSFIRLYQEDLDWSVLCAFLDKEIPSEKFPHLNKSENFYEI